MKEGYQVVREIVQAVNIHTECSHNSMVIYWSHPNKEKMDTLQFRLLLAQGLMEKHGSGVLCPLHGRPSSHCLNDSRKDISWSVFPPRGRRQDLTENVWCAQERAREKKLGCNECEKALCLEGRFKAYHTLLNF
jgi:hypothetical protein